MWDELDGCWRTDVTRRVELLAMRVGHDMYERAYALNARRHHSLTHRADELEADGATVVWRSEESVTPLREGTGWLRR